MHLRQQAADRVLACRIKPTSDLRIHVLGKMCKNVCRIVVPPPVVHAEVRASL